MDGCAGKIIQWGEINFQDPIRLSPYDHSKPLKLLTDRTSSKGVGFVLLQLRNKSKPELGCTIVAANSSALKEAQIKYSPVDVELLSIWFAAQSFHKRSVYLVSPET